eukprot:CAMPEP_0197316526 /NCGR_PEP_ID=MMETSP0891-20130614/42889_1 /TAXON_ID=44058 ORGANISM="Aureoumbra lagunensis, Strain CCMP1510" /NCGR_SAMPLE_ID=MMETSP0891 /ASSEMBLY_ACC=CAM_ASM_000534 /LENGTH=523 /DNA_ID=CAMNT_0042806019 /DNA_START=15 /DNA_END=1586 /DNA_ORIENTATION=+
MQGRKLFLKLFLFSCSRNTMGYDWRLDATYLDAKISFSETYMYGTDQGPWPVATGDSFISVDFDWQVHGISSNQAILPVKAAVVYSTKLVDIIADDFELCGNAPILPNYVKKIEMIDFFLPLISDDNTPTLSPTPSTTLVPTSEIHNSTRRFLAADQIHRAAVNHRFSIQRTGLQTLVLEACSNEANEMIFTGNIGFKNPYGWLPARFFGFMPFEFARGLGFLVLLLMLTALICHHRADDNVITVHYGLLFVIALGAAEAWTWFISYLVLNSTGTPLCCPFGSLIIASMSLSAVQQTAARALLLTVALGLGLIKSSLGIRDTICILALSLAYLASSIAVEANKIISHDNLDDGHRKDDDDRRKARAQATTNAWIDAPQLLFDLIFLVWIYSALCTTTELLRHQNQTYKLQMFQRLNAVIAIFVFIATILTGVYLAGTLGLLSWPWYLDWLQVVSIEILNFAVLAAISIIWRPTDRSKLLIMHDQISTNEYIDDDDEDLVDDDDDGHRVGDGIELGTTSNSVLV